MQEQLAAQLEMQRQQTQQAQSQVQQWQRQKPPQRHASPPHSGTFDGCGESSRAGRHDADQLWADPSQPQLASQLQPPFTPQPAVDGRAPLSMADLKAEMAASLTKRG